MTCIPGSLFAASLSWGCWPDRDIIAAFTADEEAGGDSLTATTAV